MINNFIAYESASYIRDLTVSQNNKKAIKTIEFVDTEKTEIVVNEGIMVLMAMNLKALPSDMLGA